MNFPKSMLGYTKSPLGIIGLFIVLVYGIAAFAFSQGSQSVGVDITPLICFLSLFPVLVFMGFVWLVAKHHTKLYGPADFQDEELFLRSNVESVASLLAADLKHGKSGSGLTEEKLNSLFELMKRMDSSSRQKEKGARTRALWVDDNPESCVFERKALEAQGIDFTIALSTKSALEQLENTKFGVIVSDMGREEGPQEGYVLLREIQERNIDTPFVIYSGSDKPEHRKMARQRGAIGSTNRPDELFTLVMNALSDAH